MPNPEELLLKCPDRSFGHAVALGLTNKGGRTGHAEELDLALEIARHVIRTVVVAQHETLGHARPLERAQVPGHALPDRIQRLPAAGAGGGVDAHKFARAVVNRDKDVGITNFRSLLGAVDQQVQGSLISTVQMVDEAAGSCATVAPVPSATIRQNFRLESRRAYNAYQTSGSLPVEPIPQAGRTAESSTKNRMFCDLHQHIHFGIPMSNPVLIRDGSAPSARPAAHRPAGRAALRR